VFELITATSFRDKTRVYLSCSCRLFKTRLANSYVKEKLFYTLYHTFSSDPFLNNRRQHNTFQDILNDIKDITE